MLNLRQHTANYEITLAILGAFGMMSMMLQPLMGKVIMGGALSLLFVLYFLDVLMPRDMEDDSRFQLMIDRINYLGAACSSVLLLLLLLFLPGSIYPAVISAGLMIICLALNAAHRYLYRIHDQEYYYRQLRLILLTGITVLVLVMGR
jgi:hypothetical protein